MSDTGNSVVVSGSDAGSSQQVGLNSPTDILKSMIASKLSGGESEPIDNADAAEPSADGVVDRGVSDVGDEDAPISFSDIKKIVDDRQAVVDDGDDGDEFTIDSGRDDMPLEERQRLMRADYTKKSQANAKLRKEYEEGKRKLEDEYRQLESYKQQLMAYAQNMQQPQQQYGGNQANPSIDELSKVTGIPVEDLESDNSLKANALLSYRNMVSMAEQQRQQQLQMQQQVRANQIAGEWKTFQDTNGLKPSPEADFILYSVMSRTGGGVAETYNNISRTFGAPGDKDGFIEFVKGSPHYNALAAAVIADLENEFRSKSNGGQGKRVNADVTGTSGNNKSQIKPMFGMGNNMVLVDNNQETPPSAFSSVVKDFMKRFGQ